MNAKEALEKMLTLPLADNARGFEPWGGYGYKRKTAPGSCIAEIIKHGGGVALALKEACDDNGTYQNAYGALIEAMGPAGTKRDMSTRSYSARTLAEHCARMTVEQRADFIRLAISGLQ